MKSEQSSDEIFGLRPQMKWNPPPSPREAGFLRVAISSTEGGFLPPIWLDIMDSLFSLSDFTRFMIWTAKSIDWTDNLSFLITSPFLYKFISVCQWSIAVSNMKRQLQQVAVAMKRSASGTWSEARPCILMCRKAHFIGRSPASFFMRHRRASFKKRTFVGKVMFLLFNMLFWLLIVFLWRGKNLLISWLQSHQKSFWSPRK